MPYGLYMAAAGAKAQDHRLQIVSQNLANVDTPGFKPQVAMQQARFSELIERGEAAAGAGDINDLGGGTTIPPAQTEFRGGPVRMTGNKTDFALTEADRFFVVESGGEQLLTRAGNFLFDSAGRLVTPGGDPVLSTAGVPVQVTPDLPYQVLDGGVIQQGDTQQSLLVARPAELGDLSRAGENLFRPLGDVQFEVGPDRPIKHGAIEMSAVNATSTMMDLIEASRMYEANIRMIQNQDNLLGTLIGRVLQ